MTETRPRRKQSWMKSQSDGFRPVKQVGVAASIGFPLVVVGAILLIIAFTSAGSWLWIAAGVVLGFGILAGISHRVL